MRKERRVIASERSHRVFKDVLRQHFLQLNAMKN